MRSFDSLLVDAVYTMKYKFNRKGTQFFSRHLVASDKETNTTKQRAAGVPCLLKKIKKKKQTRLV